MDELTKFIISGVRYDGKEEKYMNIPNMSILEIETRLEILWNIADRIGSGSAEYDNIVDEVRCIQSYCREHNIVLDESIAARF